MKTLFLEAPFEGTIELDRSVIDKLPSKLGIITTVQYTRLLSSIKKQLKDKRIFTGKSQKHEAQVLGCDTGAAMQVKDKVDAFLYIGDGYFHPLIVAVETELPVYQYFPVTKKLKLIEKKEIEDYKKKRKGALLKFHSSNTIGILVSTKQGQYYNIANIEKLEKKYADKTFYIFTFETLNFNDLQNFPFVEAWVNTACPRIEEDIRTVNIKDIL